MYLFPAVLYLVSSSTGHRHSTPFLVSARHAVESFPLERVVFQAPGQTGFCKTTNTRSLRSVRLGTARRRDGQCQVCIILNAAFPLTKIILPCRPTGWHGESGAARSGSHITVDFCSLRNRHIATNHVYPTDDAYPKTIRWTRGK